MLYSGPVISDNYLQYLDVPVSSGRVFYNESNNNTYHYVNNTWSTLYISDSSILEWKSNLEGQENINNIFKKEIDEILGIL